MHRCRLPQRVPGCLHALIIVPAAKVATPPNTEAASVELRKSLEREALTRKNGGIATENSRSEAAAIRRCGPSCSADEVPPRSGQVGAWEVERGGLDRLEEVGVEFDGGGLVDEVQP